MNRRHAILAAGALAATAAGVGGYLLQRGRDDPAVTALWPLQLETPEGTSLAVASLRGRPLVVNFWATWCPPCVREMPLIDAFFRAHAQRGWQVLGIAADNAPAVRDYLKRSPVGYPVALAGFAGIDLARQLGNLSGGLPFTVVLDRRGALRERHLGELSNDVLAGWVQSIS